MQYKAQYNNNNYQKKSYDNSGSGNNGGHATLTTTKKDGCILVVELNNQNLVLKGFYQNKGIGKFNSSGWKLFPYYDKTKQNPSFNKPKTQYGQQNPMDDQLPDNEVNWSKESPTDFNPDQYEQELG